ncbi:GNAT family N-acetyltransferase [Segetibacter sp. 3557_3]|uniref:GNAT family N-acetyltransferase n=1 Tax=Segetibacter sp. 3557_3 TaxID=2547429 RepID=UPI001058A605|nr:GNAT family N-acetyltransferase [Segetibacter sp. 3557_3]TDH28047.1 GNAT family N-acetyltransferase [Segetibacter sp. 3557_3]
MSFTYKRLDWDSRFFNLEIIAAHQQIASADDLVDLASLMRQEQLDLAYLYTKGPFNLVIPTGFEMILADQKVTYHKQVVGTTEANPHITDYTQNYANDKLQMLALESGFYSRFNVDPHFNRQQFEGLYTSWLDASIKKQIADAVLVYTLGTAILAFITLSKKNNLGKIGLLAVDPGYRNKGIGKRLLNAAENWFIKQGLSQAEVVTQLANKPACKLYESAGFRLHSVEHVYHVWRKRD